jgi:hypothetical protein
MMSIIQGIADHLIIIMGIVLSTALLFKWLAFKSSKKDDLYFTSLTKEIEKIINEKKGEKIDIDKTENFLEDLLQLAIQRLPNRSLRSGNIDSSFASKPESTDSLPINDYLSGSKSLINNILSEIESFKSKFPPNFYDLSYRILDKDKNWTHLYGLIPIKAMSRLIDILPGLFIVGGIFGTFIGINAALPEITKLDFQNIEESSKIISSFVNSVTFSMQTSIFGIVYSVIMTVLSTLFPLDSNRDMIQKKIEDCFEGLWYKIQGEYSAEKEILNTLPKIYELMLNGNKNTESLKNNDYEKAS